MTAELTAPRELFVTVVETNELLPPPTPTVDPQLLNTTAATQARQPWMTTRMDLFVILMI